MKRCANKSAHARRLAKARKRAKRIVAQRLHVERAGPTLKAKEVAAGAIQGWLRNLWTAVARG